MAKPAPVPKQIVCSECGLPWDAHTKGLKADPTVDVCVRLLKAELARRPSYAQLGSPTWGSSGIPRPAQ